MEVTHMSKMGQYVIGLIEEGKAYQDHKGELIVSSDKYEIERGVPVPKSVGKQGRWDDLPFENMSQGDSFVVDDLPTRDEQMSLRGRTTRENNKDTDKFYSVVKNPEKPDSYRVFRVK
jgi:hypothetical protein